ncbi:hypothetical protein [Kitasatospora sp. NPDC088548]|uniref:hypothetical protein n=1 Tax=Kitasatospora sp. NPDC088548 TaxID=3364075 RepID=UPI00381985B4
MNGPATGSSDEGFHDHVAFVRSRLHEALAQPDQDPTEQQTLERLLIQVREIADQLDATVPTASRVQVRSIVTLTRLARRWEGHPNYPGIRRLGSTVTHTAYGEPELTSLKEAVKRIGSFVTSRAREEERDTSAGLFSELGNVVRIAAGAEEAVLTALAADRPDLARTQVQFLVGAAGRWAQHPEFSSELAQAVLRGINELARHAQGRPRG